MAPVLIGATVLFAVLAIVMSLVASRAMRENRARSAARIAALQAAVAAASHAAAQAEPAFTPAPAPAPAQNWDFSLRAPSSMIEEQRPEPPKPQPRQVKAAAIVPVAEVRDSQFDVPGSSEHDLFEQPVPRTPGRRWTWTIAAGLMMASAAGIIWVISSGVINRMAFTSKNATALAAAASPIELLSLRHSTEPSGTFVVTGLVQNPAASSSLRGVFAVAYLFDKDGNYFASSRAALESAVLSPGGETAFVVRIPAPGSSATPVSRYRISFQQEDGAAVNHVDRRGSMPAGTTGDAVDTPSTTTSIVAARKIG